MSSETSVDVPRCPLTWARALRRNTRLSARERHECERWLEYHGWQLQRDPWRAWIDPRDGDDWSLIGAIRVQVRYEAAHALARHGWELVDPPKWAARAWPLAALRNRSRAIPIASALARLGADPYPPVRSPSADLPEPARPVLRLIRGGLQ